MAPAGPATHNNHSDDDLDDILNGVIDGQDIFDTSNIRAQTEPQNDQRPAATDASLGLDEEIKIEKKRRPIPKLDVDKLVSPAGIPRLQKISKERLRFKGKGHEYGDIARMLTMYQLWLDDLYPRAKFADGLEMIEKLGHTKHMQIYRKEWINNSKPKIDSDSEHEDEDQPAPVETVEQNTEQMEGLQLESVDKGDSSQEQRQDGDAGQAGESDQVMDNGDPDEDELDALLAESAAPNATPAISQPKPTTHENDAFADEMDAMADMEDMW